MDWDILNLDEEDGWVHKQIQYRLKDKGIECLMADIWYGDNAACLLGCYESADMIARALNMNPECVYGNTAYGFIILNLYQEKCLRKHKY